MQYPIFHVMSQWKSGIAFRSNRFWQSLISMLVIWKSWHLAAWWSRWNVLDPLEAAVGRSFDVLFTRRHQQQRRETLQVVEGKRRPNESTQYTETGAPENYTSLLHSCLHKIRTFDRVQTSAKKVGNRHTMTSISYSANVTVRLSVTVRNNPSIIVISHSSSKSNSNSRRVADSSHQLESQNFFKWLANERVIEHQTSF